MFACRLLLQMVGWFCCPFCPLTALFGARPLRGGWLVAQAFALRCAEGSLRCSVLEGQQRTRPRTPSSIFAVAKLGAQTALLDAAARRNLPGPALLGCSSMGHQPPTPHRPGATPRTARKRTLAPPRLEQSLHPMVACLSGR